MMDINVWLGLGTFFVLIAGASFAFVNKFFINPVYQYVDIRCSFNKLAYLKDDLVIKVEKRNGKIHQVFCPSNKSGYCQGTDALAGVRKVSKPEKCWVYEN